MINEKLSKKILTLGTDKNGKGGIASVLKAYDEYVFAPFFFVRTHAEGSFCFKLIVLLKAFIKIPLYVLFRGVQIIHLHSASYNCFRRKRILVNYCLLFRVNIVFHIHGAEFYVFANKYGVEKIRKTFLKCKKVIVLSPEWEKLINEKIKFFNTVVVNNIIPLPEKQQVEANDDFVRILFLGAIGKRKGIFDLLGIMVDNKNHFHGKIKLVIGGNGEISKLTQYISDNQLEPIVEYVGWVSGERKKQLLNECDVFVLPSYHEGLPISILEAMSYGKAIISTAVGGIPEIVKDEKNGYLITAGDTVALKRSIDRFIENKKLLNIFGNYSEQIVNNFLPDKVILQLENIYNEILDNKKRNVL